MAERSRLQDTVLALVFALQTLFPPHPLAFSRLIALVGTRKEAPIVKRAATYADYAAHLSPEAYSGVGAIGMFPGISNESEPGKTKWFAPFFVADFDAARPLELVPLIDTLAGFGLMTYPTCGTSGRGAHLYGFTESLMPQWELYSVVKGIQMMAADAGLGLPEIRPSCKFGRGSPIFLPYRGALKDGYGYNPLLDPERDFQPVALEYALQEVKRIPTAALETFRLDMESRATHARFAARAKDKPIDAVVTFSTEDTLTYLRDEFERVKAHFVKPNRQHLVMGLAAYGVRGLELDAATLRKEVTAFVNTHDADELPRRLEALENTIAKYKRDPHSVAWKPYYVSAGLTAPGKVGVSNEVMGRLELAVRSLTERRWKGVAGSSDRSVYVALIRLATEHGASHKVGVAVSVSVRDLALKAGVGGKTICAALVRLKKAHLVVRGVQTDRQLGHAGVLVLVVDKVHELPHSFPLLGGLKEWGYLYTHPAFRHGKLGKSAAPPLVTLLTEARPLTRPELAKLLGRKSQALRGPLKKLVYHKLVTVSESACVLSPLWEEALDRAAIVTGAYRTEEQQRQVYLVERLTFQARLEKNLSSEKISEAA